MVIPCQKKSILSQRFGANSKERMDFFCVGHMHSLTYLSTICKYYSSSSTSAYVCTRRHVRNSRKRHDIDGAKNGAKWQMSPNVGSIFSDMSPTCRPTRQCRVKIGNADIRKTQLSRGHLDQTVLQSGPLERATLLRGKISLVRSATESHPTLSVQGFFERY
jgi:hypothetical protein